MSARDLIPVNDPQEHNGMRLLRMIQARHPNYHPALAISDLANNSEVDHDLAFRCHATLLKYVEPELRSVQIQADVKETRTIRVSLFEPLEGDPHQRIEDTSIHAPKLPNVIDVEAIRETVAVEASRSE